jgi:hypothetical protein
MENRENQENNYDRARDDNAWLVVKVIGVLLACLGMFFLIFRFHLRPEQLIEIAVYLGCVAGFAWSAFRYHKDYKEKRKRNLPRLRVHISCDRHEDNIQKSFAQKSTLVGYSAVSKRTVSWSDEVRTLQSILVGKSGFGKTTFMRNLAGQDARRVFDIEGRQRRMPMVIFDGKGDRKFMDRLIEDFAAIGRLQDVRLLDPSRPELSVRYNPLYLADEDDNYEEYVNFIFESFGLKQDFFKDHQATYFNDLVRVLTHTGKVHNIHDVLVIAQDPIVMQEQVAIAIYRAENESGVTTQQRLNLQMSIRNLWQSFQDSERISKIQGLLNPLMTFLQEKLSLITGPYDQLVTLSDVFEQDLILLVPLNGNTNERALSALGRILLRNLQLMVGQRYERAARMRQGLPPVSVILDEFSTFAYSNFTRILETARDSKVLFTFSLQSITALDTVSPGFRDRLTAAPSTIMLMQSWDEASTDYFQRSAPSIQVDQLTVSLEERGMLWKKYERTGRATARTVEEPLVPQSQVGFLPRGQMHMLMADPRGKPRYVRLYVPQPSTASLSCFQPMVYPPAPASNWRAEGANLRFKDLDFLRKFPRISGRRGA